MLSFVMKVYPACPERFPRGEPRRVRFQSRHTAAHAACFTTSISFNSFTSFSFRTLAPHFQTSVFSNPCKIKRFRTLCKIPGIGYPPPSLFLDRRSIRSALFPAVHPISLQSLTKCSSRNSFALITIHFHGGGCTPPIPESRTKMRRPSVLDEFAQAPESVVPLPGDQIKVAADVLEAQLIQLPDALPAVPSATHETRVLHDAQVFGDCLTRDVEASGKPRDGRRSVVTEAGDQSQAGFVAQRREERRRAEQLRRRLWTTPPGQGTSRAASRPHPSLAPGPGMPLPGAPAGFDRSRIR
jgi:hypothetical protein